MKTIAFFNNKGGVGKTSLVYHLAWMYAEMGIPTLAVDLDPQANLTSMFLKESRLEALWENVSRQDTIYSCLEPSIDRAGDLADPHVEKIGDRLGLIAGDLALSRFEDLLSENWTKASDGRVDAFRVLTSFHRIILSGANQIQAKLVLIDVGPNLGAINRTAMIAAQHLVLPLAPDLFSLQGLKNLGPTLREDWRKGWRGRLTVAPASLNLPLPDGAMQPAGYVVMQHGIRDSRPVQAYQKWMNRIPQTYREYVLGESGDEVPKVDSDPHMLALLKHYRSLMPLAMEARKPIFHLTASDGAIGSNANAVGRCREEFEELALKIQKSVGFTS